MDKLKLFFITLVVSFVYVGEVYAVEPAIAEPQVTKEEFKANLPKKKNNVQNSNKCTTAYINEMISLAKYVKADYEVIDNSTTKKITIGKDVVNAKIPNYSFLFSIYNITDKVYVRISSNSTANYPQAIYSVDANDGMYTFADNNFGNIFNYTIFVYPNNANCSSRLLKKITITKPKYNAYSEYTYCKNSSNYYCQKFVNKDLKLKNSDDFMSKIAVNNKLNNPNIPLPSKVVELIKQNWKLYIKIFVGATLFIILLVVLIRYYNKKKRWKL